MDLPLYFKIVISKWPKVFKEIDHGYFRVVGPDPCTSCRLTFKLLSIIVRPYQNKNNDFVLKWLIQCNLL